MKIVTLWYNLRIVMLYGFFMSEGNNKKYTVKATLFSREFDIGYDPVYSLRATSLSSGKYLIESKSGHGPAEVAIGDEFQGAGKIELNANGDLVFGGKTIPVGHNLVYGVTAEPKNDEKTKFAIFTKGKAKVFYKQISLGDIDEKTGIPWSVDQYNNLINGETSVKVVPQLNSRSLNVRGEVDSKEALEKGLKNAFYASFDYVDSIEGRSHTTWGFYVRNHFDKNSAEFKEVVHGELITTARVRFERNGFSVSMRTPESAYLSHVLYKSKRDLEQQLEAFSDPYFVKKTMKGLPQDVVESFKRELNEQLKDVTEKLDLSKKDWIKGQRFFVKEDHMEFLMGKKNNDDRAPSL